MFPTTAEEFKALMDLGKTVEYIETDSEQNPPEGEWSFWARREGETETKAVWRRIADL